MIMSTGRHTTFCKIINCDEKWNVMLPFDRRALSTQTDKLLSQFGIDSDVNVTI